MSNNTSSNKAVVPEAKGALDRFKFEVANELGWLFCVRVTMLVCGFMVKKMIEQQERQMSSGSQSSQY